MCLCWVYNFMILLYRNSTTKNISQNHKIVHFENYSFIGAIPFGGCSYSDILCCSSILK